MNRNQIDSSDDPPPILGTWKRLYALVLVTLCVVVLVIYVIGRVFS